MKRNRLLIFKEAKLAEVNVSKIIFHVEKIEPLFKFTILIIGVY